MNISATTAVGYTYTNTTGVTQKEAVSNENVCQKQTKKEYKNVVREFKQKHPDRASHVKAAGTIINADGSVSGWSITEDDNGDASRGKTKLDKDKRDTWEKKILEMHKEKRIKEKKEAQKRLEEKRSDKSSVSYGDILVLSQEGLDSARELMSKKQ